MTARVFLILLGLVTMFPASSANASNPDDGEPPPRARLEISSAVSEVLVARSSTAYLAVRGGLTLCAQ